MTLSDKNLPSTRHFLILAVVYSTVCYSIFAIPSHSPPWLARLVEGIVLDSKRVESGQTGIGQVQIAELPELLCLVCKLTARAPHCFVFFPTPIAHGVIAKPGVSLSWDENGPYTAFWMQSCFCLPRPFLLVDIFVLPWCRQSWMLLLMSMFFFFHCFFSVSFFWPGSFFVWHFAGDGAHLDLPSLSPLFVYAFIMRHKFSCRGSNGRQGQP